MVDATVPSHLNLISDNMKEVRRLLEIHKLIAGGGVGHKHEVEVLNKSALVLIVACWESYIEALAIQSFEIMLKEAKSHADFPMSVLQRVSEPLRKSADPREVWKISDAGWRTALQNYKGQILDRYIGNFNTPSPGKIDELFECLIGLDSSSAKWRWKGMPNTQCISKLENLLLLRHEIAHKVTAHKKVSKGDVKKYGNHIYRLSATVSNIVGAHLKTHTGKEPWSIKMQLLKHRAL